jgi:hypothetical protein
MINIEYKPGFKILILGLFTRFLLVALFKTGKINLQIVKLLMIKLKTTNLLLAMIL